MPLPIEPKPAAQTQIPPPNVADEAVITRARLDALLACEPWMVLALRADLTVEFCNDAYAKFVGMTVEALQGKNLLELFPVLAKTRSLAAYREVLSTGKPARVEGWLGKRCMASNVHAAPWGLIAIEEDITEFKQAIEAAAAGPKEESGRLDDARHELVLQGTRDVVWEWDVPSNRSRYAGPLREMLHLPPEAPEPDFGMVNRRMHADDRERVQLALEKHIETNKPYEETFRVQRADGTWITVESRGRVLRDEKGMPWRVLGSLRDITERIRLHEQLLQAQKMEGIGRLAGGIAHDFNNLLTAILGYTELAAAKIGEPDHVLDALEKVKLAGDRAAALTRQLLGFARKQVTQPRVVNVNQIVGSVHKMLRLGADIEIRTSLADDAGEILIDPNQLEQVLINLAVNARDAMPTGGKLTFETRGLMLDEDLASRRPGLTPGEHVLIAVSDTGTGMTSEVKDRLFEPFFTTKEPGKGTGLGLATCYGIVKQNRGHIAAYSELGRGASFALYFPRVRQGVQPMPAESSQVPRGTENVLLVDDEPLVREIAKLQLKRLGYAVTEVADGESALKLLKNHAIVVDLLVTDMVMPKLGGPELAAAAKAARPGLRVMFMSGYAEAAAGENGLAMPDVVFLHKPFSQAELARKVRQALDVSKA